MPPRPTAPDVPASGSRRPAIRPGARPPGPGLEEALTYRMHLLHKLTDQESQRRYPDEAGLSLSEGRCLAAIGSFEPVSVMELAHKANLDKGQASRAAQSLVEQGLVRKGESPTDGRGVALTLTAAGRRTWRRTMALVERRNEDIFGCLSAAEQRQLGALLDRLIAHARGAATGPDR